MIKTLSPREELEIGVMISSSEELIDYVLAGRLDTSEIREALREVVSEIGVGHTDEYLTEVTVNRIRHDLGGRF
jgi:hypothetical protein